MGCKRTTREAEVFDDAASVVARRNGYTCWIVAQLDAGTSPERVDPTFSYFSDLRSRYSAAFDDFSYSFDGRRNICNRFHSKHQRIVAMGFAAAMAETGDL